MKLQISKYSALLMFTAVLLGCHPTAKVAAESDAGTEKASAPQPAMPPDTVPQDRAVDDTARFLAGMPGNPGSAFQDLEQDAAWLEHQKSMDAAWAKADTRLIRGLRQFQQSELADPAIDRNVLFYPFSGPDSLTATLCFPHSADYVMVALEPAGTLPARDKLNGDTVPRYLDGVRTTVASVLGKSFFVTREMDHELRGQVTDGLLVPTLLLLVRTGHTMLGMRYVRIDEDGKIVERPGGVPVQAAYANKGFEIQFRTDSDQSVHRLYYFSLNLENKRVKANKGFLQFEQSLPVHDTMLKATSYMTHHPDFSVIRDLVLDHSAAVFQDDSGVPYHFFTTAQWNVQLYGEYTKPYGSFAFLEQADLRKAYQTPGVKPLALRLGYGFGKVASNLLLAKRVK